MSFYSALVALAEADLLDREGGREAALAVFEQAWAIGPHNLGRDWADTGTLSRFAELAARFGLADRCAELEPLVTPFDGQFILETCIELRCSVAWLLGGLAHAQGRRDEAIAHYERALALETANGAVLMAERTRADLERVRASG
jgi:tetratricopeptide (TPR) repeat protein